MKKPLINLTAVERVDAVPLRKALELYQKGAGEVAAARVREANLQKEIEDYLSKVSPDDAQAIQTVSAKKIQAEILPRLIAKVEGTLATDVVPTLLREADRFKSGLRRFYSEAHAAAAEQLAAVFRPYFADRQGANGAKEDRALAIAMQSDDCGAISARLAEADRIHISDQPRSNNPAHYDQALAEAAKALLELAERN